MLRKSRSHSQNYPTNAPPGATYFAQELLTTFPNIGEISLRPSKGGLFRVEISYYDPFVIEGATPTGDETIFHKVLWDRKEKGGFPEVKVLKQLVRDCIDPKRDLGHSDGHKIATKPEEKEEKEEPVAKDFGVKSEVGGDKTGEVCVDCLP